MAVELEINGRQYSLKVQPSRTLLEVLREDFKMAGTKQGCASGNCGACTVLMNGKAVKSCMVLIGQARGALITTIEGMEVEGHLHPIQRAFIDHFAVQCGFCTPGMIMSAKAILDDSPHASETEIRQGIRGNICRCTGYVKIVEAIEAARDIINEDHGQGGDSS